MRPSGRSPGAFLRPLCATPGVELSRDLVTRAEGGGGKNRSAPPYPPPLPPGAAAPPFPRAAASGGGRCKGGRAGAWLRCTPSHHQPEMRRGVRARIVPDCLVSRYRLRGGGLRIAGGGESSRLRPLAEHQSTCWNDLSRGPACRRSSWQPRGVSSLLHVVLTNRLFSSLAETMAAPREWSPMVSLR